MAVICTSGDGISKFVGQVEVAEFEFEYVDAKYAVAGCGVVFAAGEGERVILDGDTALLEGIKKVLETKGLNTSDLEYYELDSNSGYQGGQLPNGRWHTFLDFACGPKFIASWIRTDQACVVEL